MRRHGALLVLLLPALVAGLRAARGEEPEAAVEARLDLEPGLLGPQTVMYLPLGPTAPEGARLPEDLKDPRFARIRWGTGPGLLVAVDLATGWERVWVDADLDGDLAAEPRFRWRRESTPWTREETVRVVWQDEGEERVPVQLWTYVVGTETKVRIQPMVHRLGDVVLGGRLRPVALTDGNADLRFDDPERDHLWLDVDGDGRIDPRADGHEHIRPGVPFRVGAEGWIATHVATSGRTVRFEPTVDAPPPTPRAWPATGVPTAGITVVAPTEALEDVLRRVREEMDLEYVQRYETIGLLGRFAVPEAERVLIALAESDRDANVRGAAVRALGYAPHLEGAGAAVLRLARTGDGTVASAAIQALHGMAHPDRESVYRELLDASDANVAGQAARYLAYLRPEGVEDLLVQRYGRAGAPALRYQIYNGIRTLPDGPPVAVARTAAKDAYDPLRAQGLRDLWVLAPWEARELALVAAEARPVSTSAGPAILEVLGAAGDGEATAALLAMAPDVPANLATALLEALAPVRGPEAVAALLAGLKDRAPAVRALAAQVLAGIRRPEVTRALVERTRREKDDEVLVYLIEALGDQRNEDAIDVLLKETKTRRREVRLAAVRALARIGHGHPKVQRFLVSLLDAKDGEERILALDAAAASGDASLCDRIVPSLDHERWAARLAAAEALGRIRCPGAIPHLIDRLETEEERRVRDALAKTLFLLTGMNLYDDADTWRRWWAGHAAGFVMPEKVPELPPEEAGGTRAGFYGIPVTTGRAIFVLDQSGSMSAEDSGPVVTGQVAGNRLDVAVRQVLEAIKGMNERDRVNVILFHTGVYPWKDTMQRMTAANRKALERHLLAQRPLGGTNLYDALEQALADEDVDTIFLLSDGAPGLGRYVATDDILRAVRRLNQTRRVQIHCVSIGRDADLMQRLAEENGGRYVRR